MRLDLAFLLGGAGVACVRDMAIVNLRTGLNLATNRSFTQGSRSMPSPWWLYQSSSQFTKAEVIRDPSVPLH